MMMSAVGAAAYTSAALVAFGLVAIVSADAAAYQLAMVQIGADTEVQGLTIGAILVGLVSGVGGLWVGARMLFRLAADISRWRTGLDKAVQIGQLVERLEHRISAHEERIAGDEDRIARNERRMADLESSADDVRALQRWRADIVDPSLVRGGIGKPNPVGDLKQLIIDEAAG